MKSKKFIALAMLCMTLIAIAGSIFSQSNSSNTDYKLASSSMIMEFIEEHESAMHGEIDQMSLINLPNVEVEVAQIESVNTVMSYQSLAVVSDATQLSGTLENNSEDAELENEETQTVEAEPEEESTTAAPAYVIYCTDEEYWLLVRLVESEAGTTDVVGRMMVANVVINRVKDSYFPNSITGVIYSEGQFMPVTTGYIWQVNVSYESIEAVDRALLGEDYSQGATYFSSTASAAAGNWHSRALKRLFEYGGNVYYTRY